MFVSDVHIKKWFRWAQKTFVEYYLNKCYHFPNYAYIIGYKSLWSVDDIFENGKVKDAERIKQFEAIKQSGKVSKGKYQIGQLFQFFGLTNIILSVPCMFEYTFIGICWLVTGIGMYFLSKNLKGKGV